MNNALSIRYTAGIPTIQKDEIISRNLTALRCVVHSQRRALNEVKAAEFLHVELFFHSRIVIKKNDLMQSEVGVGLLPVFADAVNIYLDNPYINGVE